MDTNAKQLAQCLPAGLVARIEEIKAREARKGMRSALGSDAGKEDGPAIPAPTEGGKAENVIYLDTNMRAGDRTRTPRRGPARIFVFRQNRHG